MAKSKKPIKKNHLDKVKDAAQVVVGDIESRKPLLGRPTIYTEELGERICKAIENSPRGLRWICENNPDFPTSETIRDWLSKNTFPIFSARYARARRMQADFLSDELIDVAYDSNPDGFGRVEKPKLIVEAIKWKAKVLEPKIYGDNPEKFLDTKEDEAGKTTKETLADKIGKITGLIAKKKKIEGEEK
jgi:hypothetical protein